MSAPLVSFVMPVHNAAPYVGAAIRSVLAQTIPDFELIVVNDASTDDSADAIAACRDPRMHCRRSDSQMNAAGARNLAMEHARGEFIAFLDADDIAMPDRLECQISALRSHTGAGIAASLITSIDERGRSLGRGFVKPWKPDEIAPVLLFENCLALSSVTARKAVLKPFRAPFAPAEDYDLWMRLATETQSLIIPRELTQYRTHASGVSARQPEQMRAAIDIIHSAQLVRLELEPCEIHARLSAWPLNPAMEELLEAGQWLCKLARANARHAAYRKDVFTGILRERWFTICLDSWQLGWPVWDIFHRSPLAAPTLVQRGQLFRRLYPRLFRR